MYQFEKVSYQEALRLVQYALQQAEKQNGSIAVTVVGPEGELIAFVRMDGVNPSSSTISQNKAYTAARCRDETFKLGERMRTKDNPTFWGDPRFTGFGGGIPIIQKGNVIGAIGVSGLPEAEDMRIVKEAVKEVFGY